MSEPSERTFSSDFKRFFVRGLVILLPSVLTLWIVVMAYKFIDENIAEPINRGVRLTMNYSARFWEPLREPFDPPEEQVQERMMEALRFQYEPSEDEIEAFQMRMEAEGRQVPTEEQARIALVQQRIHRRIEQWEREDRRVPSSDAILLEMRQRNIHAWWTERWYMNLIGLGIAVIAVYTAGRLLGGYFGRRIYLRLESVITSIPVFKQVYPYVRQIVDFLFSEDQPIKFNRVVVVEYPRRGIWSVGFLTGPTLRSVAERSGKAVTIFIPSSPTPFTGYTITVPQEEVIEVPISVDEAIRFAVSGGVLIPDHQQLDLVPKLGNEVATDGQAEQPGARPPERVKAELTRQIAAAGKGGGPDPSEASDAADEADERSGTSGGPSGEHVERKSQAKSRRQRKRKKHRDGGI